VYSRFTVSYMKNNNIFSLNYKYFIYIVFGCIPISHVIGNSMLNLNIILCGLIFLSHSILKKEWSWCGEKLFKWLIILYIFFILNSINSIFFKIDHNNIYGGIIRSFSFIKFVILIFSFRLISIHKIKLDYIIKTWLIITLIIVFDVFFESYFGKNLIGNISPDHTRIVSFFKDELVVGNFILFYGFIIYFYFISKKQLTNIEIIFYNLFLFLILISIFLSGERSNFIKSLIVFLIVITLIENKKLILKKIYLILSILLIISSTLTINNNVKLTYLEFFDRMSVSKKEGFQKFENIKYFVHYDVAIKIFKDNFFIGVGNKNFRWDCHKIKYFDPQIKLSSVRCSNHPHQVHLEILSEHGIIGYILIFYILFNFLFLKFKFLIKNKFHFEWGLMLLLFTFFIPILPSGSLFSSFGGSFFWLTFSLLNYRLDEIDKFKKIN